MLQCRQLLCMATCVCFQHIWFTSANQTTWNITNLNFCWNLPLDHREAFKAKSLLEEKVNSKKNSKIRDTTNIFVLSRFSVGSLPPDKSVSWLILSVIFHLEKFKPQDNSCSHQHILKHSFFLLWFFKQVLMSFDYTRRSINMRNCRVVS